MRKVIISDIVQQRIKELECYLVDELKLSEEAALKRSRRMRIYIASLGNPMTFHALCRFKRWRALGYRCTVFEKSWVFAYEIFDNGVIIRDMSHTATLLE
ncbi:MAG: hypothetical protein LBE91_08800 [Tannerella sp.]|jgi:hypothetical protein|nr:hypothetical protein [Tannerella sp.]